MSELSLDDVYDEEPAEVAEPEIVEEAVEEAEPEVEAEEAKAEPEESTTDSKEKSWTFSQAMDEREKRQAWEKKAKELEDKLKALEKPEKDISVFEDEEGFKQQLVQKAQEEIRNSTLNMSQAFAEEVFGEEKVAQAIEWFKSEGVKSPYAIDQFNSAKLPFHAAVKLFEEEQVRVNPDAYKAKLKAEILEELKSEHGESPKPITPSLASKRSAGKVTEGSTEDFEDILGA